MDLYISPSTESANSPVVQFFGRIDRHGRGGLLEFDMLDLPPVPVCHRKEPHATAHPSKGEIPAAAVSRRIRSHIFIHSS